MSNIPNKFEVLTPLDNELEVLHREIDSCTVCSNFAQPYYKPVGLVRGIPSSIVIVGQEPGKAELKKRKAFAGMSGKRLDDWLRNCGLPPEAPRSGVYLTSVLKCLCPKPTLFNGMQANCQHFLTSQLSIIQPPLVITLGEKAYGAIQFSELSYDDALCIPLRTDEQLLFSPYGFDFTHLPWPHPSGLNRWHNDVKNRARLRRSFDFVRSLVRGTE